ncbi:hypothetical protein PVIIG_06377 [Plasmodium vivax India VII]|uniref:Uncharacterized protein n=1 Tax=Plasmodium vivax India VII TaxID=1077284 RepID=A0A0J9UUN4_PLAVI|nr:hypothetical protein PVIIG_06377 [Plasmodium vivax India VII]
MSQLNGEIAKWKKEYPFLINTWNLYEEFNKPVVGDEQILFYDTTCQVVLGRANKSNENYKNVCMKLMKNLGVYSNELRPKNPSNERCKTINYWLYYVTNMTVIPAEIIKTIFEQSNKIAFSGKNQHICFNTYDEEIINPLKIIKLYNLQDNIETFLSTLKKKGSADYCSCKKYIYDCVNIYKDMNDTYCTDPDDRNNKNKSTCDMLSAFNWIYTEYLFKKIDIGEKIPSLLSEEKEYIDECLSAQRSVAETTTQHNLD